MTNETTPANADALRQGLCESLQLLAAIDANGPEFNRPLDLPTFPPDPSGRGPIPPTELHWVATLSLGGQSAILRRADIERARACLKPGAAPTTAELREALIPLAKLPVDDGASGVLYRLSDGHVEISDAAIRRARELVKMSMNFAD
jgi:hypothetical protein